MYSQRKNTARHNGRQGGASRRPSYYITGCNRLTQAALASATSASASLSPLPVAEAGLMALKHIIGVYEPGGWVGGCSPRLAKVGQTHYFFGQTLHFRTEASSQNAKQTYLWYVLNKKIRNSFRPVRYRPSAQNL